MAEPTKDRWLPLRRGLNKSRPARKSSCQAQKKRFTICLVPWGNQWCSLRYAYSVFLVPFPFLSLLCQKRDFYIRRLFEWNEVRTTQWVALCICFRFRVRDKRRKISFNILNVFCGSFGSKPKKKITKKQGFMTMQNVIWRFYVEMLAQESSTSWAQRVRWNNLMHQKYDLDKKKSTDTPQVASIGAALLQLNIKF